MLDSFNDDCKLNPVQCLVFNFQQKNGQRNHLFFSQDRSQTPTRSSHPSKKPFTTFVHYYTVPSFLWAEYIRI